MHDFVMEWGSKLHMGDIVLNFDTDDLDDLFRNVFGTTVAAQGLRYVRKADWRSDRAFEMAASSEYLRPDGEVLVDMRDECDLRLMVKRGRNLIHVFACAKFRSVTVVVASASY